MLERCDTRLRGLEYEDLKLIHKWMNDFSIIRGILRIEPSIRCYTERWFDQINQDKSRIIFAIDSISHSRCIGCIGANNIEYVDRKAELYIYLGEKDFHGKGYAASAVAIFSNYMFNYLNLNKLYLHVRRDNTPAINLYLKSGFHEEGLFSKDRYIDGKYVDILRMCIFKDEFSYE